MKKFKEFVAESAEAHRAAAAHFKREADQIKPGTEAHFDAMANHHYHEGKAAQAEGKHDVASDHFHKSYGYSRKDD